MVKNKRKKRRITLLDILGGGVLKEEFIVRHTKLILFIVLLIIVFIGNRYSCTMKEKQVDTLQRLLNEKKMESLSISVELTKYSQRSQIETRIKQQGLEIESAKTPPYILHK
jgi:hypothetical protein